MNEVKYFYIYSFKIFLCILSFLQKAKNGLGFKKANSPILKLCQEEG